ncbi:MAG: phosphoribosylaminoimidazolesuccinocarboxamide synthase [Candidatus Aureabacteria bacterium]|nr:phosphoribosylaminoimidazolesuccinocarboxamide synthase [Candidatus Auribacterota bacterium]
MTHSTNWDLEELKLFKKGKVRNVYDLGDRLLFLATDRISAFDFILPTPITDKGKILTQISLFWFEFFKEKVKNHYITSRVEDYPEKLKRYADVLEKRSMVVKKTEVVPIECVVRGYLSGSGWKEYRKSSTVCGISLPEGLKESDKLDEPVFTPATKAEEGHDENISLERMRSLVGSELSERIKLMSLSLYREARDYLAPKGIILADTKFEFGLNNGDLILVDEVLTPDSSRFWPSEDYEPGRSQKSYDKQYVRDYLESIQWNKQPPVPELPSDIVENTREKYLQAFCIITGKKEL